MKTFRSTQIKSPPEHKIRLGPSGIHLFNRRTGLNVLVDEVSVRRELWALAPRQVSIALTNACDLSCSYCYAPKKPAELEFRKLLTWLDELDVNGCLGVGLGGGEPTLYRRFPEICKYVTEETGMAVTFTTHAHTMNSKLADKLHGVVHFIRVSMDGIGATYESLRGKPFAALRSHIETIRQLAPFGINFVVNKRTFLDIDRAVDFASEVGAIEFLLLPEQAVDGVGGIDSVTIQALRTWIKKYSRSFPLTISEAGSDNDPIYARVTKEKGLQAYAHIDATGAVKRSSYEHHGVLVGPEGLIEALRLMEAGQKEESK